MANKKAAEKYIKVSQKNRLRNKSTTSEVKTSIKKVEAGILSGKQDEAMLALKAFEKLGMQSVSKGMYHINTISRKISRLYARIKAMRVSA